MVAVDEQIKSVFNSGVSAEVTLSGYNLNKRTNDQTDRRNVPLMGYMAYFFVHSAAVFFACERLFFQTLATLLSSGSSGFGDDSSS